MKNATRTLSSLPQDAHLFKCDWCGKTGRTRLRQAASKDVSACRGEHPHLPLPTPHTFHHCPADPQSTIYTCGSMFLRRSLILRSWAYKIFISLAVATVLALHAAYPCPTGAHHKTTDTQTPATSATSSPVLLRSWAIFLFLYLLFLYFYFIFLMPALLRGPLDLPAHS